MFDDFCKVPTSSSSYSSMGEGMSWFMPKSTSLMSIPQGNLVLVVNHPRKILALPSWVGFHSSPKFYTKHYTTNQNTQEKDVWIAIQELLVEPLIRQSLSRMNQVLHTTSCTGCHARKASHPVWDCSANQILTKRFCKTAAVSLQHVIVPSQPLLGHHLLHKTLHFVFGVTGVAHGDGAAVDVNLMLPGFLAFNALLAEVPLLAMHLHPCVKGTADVQNVLGDVVTLQPLLVQVVDVQENLSCRFFFQWILALQKNVVVEGDCHANRKSNMPDIWKKQIRYLIWKVNHWKSFDLGDSTPKKNLIVDQEKQWHCQRHHHLRHIHPVLLGNGTAERGRFPLRASKCRRKGWPVRKSPSCRGWCH